MRRPLLVLLAALALAASVFTACYFAAVQMRATAPVAPTDELDWLRTEFRLSDAELARVRVVHNGYQPECAAMCLRIGEKNRELDALLAASTNVTSAVEQKLAEVAALRAECQAQMLRHFHQVSQTMPPEQGRRYLAEMRRLTLGLGDHATMPLSGPNVPRHAQP